jgi:hypothetical protein
LSTNVVSISSEYYSANTLLKLIMREVAASCARRRRLGGAVSQRPIKAPQSDPLRPWNFQHLSGSYPARSDHSRVILTGSGLGLQPPTSLRHSASIRQTARSSAFPHKDLLQSQYRAVAADLNFMALDQLLRRNRTSLIHLPTHRAPASSLGIVQLLYLLTFVSGHSVVVTSLSP